jgi:mitochondrial fission protein ELM1
LLGHFYTVICGFHDYKTCITIHKGIALTDKKIWVLLDERAGNTSQSLGVAEALGLPFETKQIAFNKLIKLPNFLVNKSKLGLDKACHAELTPPWPDIVISCARRLGLVATYIKSKSPSTFLAQIQWPGYPYRHFDLIATPLHDNIEAKDNVFNTLGAPHRVTAQVLKREAGKWQSRLPELPRPYIAVLVGGSSNPETFALRHGKKLAAYASELANSLGGSLLITTSRRTGAPMSDALEKNVKSVHYLYKWQFGDSSDANPYYGFLGLADAVIATGDSVSMCSEACATGKPVYIYDEPDLLSSKYRRFLNSLYEHSYAKALLEKGNSLFNPPTLLNDAAAIAEEIKKRIKWD